MAEEPHEVIHANTGYIPKTIRNVEINLQRTHNRQLRWPKFGKPNFGGPEVNRFAKVHEYFERRNGRYVRIQSHMRREDWVRNNHPLVIHLREANHAGHDIYQQEVRQQHRNEEVHGPAATRAVHRARNARRLEREARRLRNHEVENNHENPPLRLEENREEENIIPAPEPAPEPEPEPARERAPRRQREPVREPAAPVRRSTRERAQRDFYRP